MSSTHCECPPQPPNDDYWAYLPLPGLVSDITHLALALYHLLIEHTTPLNIGAAVLLLAVLPSGARHALYLTLSWLPWVILGVFSMTLQWLLVLYTSLRILLTLLGFGVVKVLRYFASSWHTLVLMWRCRSRRGVVGVYELYTLRKDAAEATTYEEWEAAVVRMEELQGITEQREANRSELVDCEQLRVMLSKLRALGSHGKRDLHELLMCLQSVVHRDFAGMDNPALYATSQLGTLRIVEELREEVVRQLEWVLHTDFSDEGFTFEHKRRFFRDLKRSLGRTALCLSGGGSLSMYHMGVIRSLLLHNAMPRIVSGASGGSIPAALVSMYTDEELLHFIKPDISNRYGVRWFRSIPHQIVHFLRHGTAMDAKWFHSTVKAYFRDCTFAEAFERTRRRVNICISVSSSRSHSSRLLLLNHVSTPNVLLSSAVTASCALPGLMGPVELEAKDHRTGQIVPYYPGQNVRFVDGSLQADIPRVRLAELFNANQFFVSQVNPHVVPFLRSNQRPDVRMSWLGRFELMLHLDLKASVAKLSHLRLIPRIFGQDVRKVFHQKYSGEVTFLPRLSLYDTFKAIQHPSINDMKRYIQEGQRCAWPELAKVRGLLQVEQAVSDCVFKTETQMKLLPGAKLVPASQLPAWTDIRGAAITAAAEQYVRDEVGENTEIKCNCCGATIQLGRALERAFTPGSDEQDDGPDSP